MKFVKMHGTGNDYIYINLIEGHDDSVPCEYDGDRRLISLEGKPAEDVIISLSDRHFGIGSDGLIAIAPSDSADVRMIMYNADGSEGAMCGNGIRCVAKFAYDKGLLKVSGNGDLSPTITVETKSGIKTLKLTIEDGICTYVEVNMGQAILKAAEVPAVESEFIKDDNTRISTEADTPTDAVVDRTLTVDGKEYRVSCVSMGNPHCVVFTDGIDDMDLESIGPCFENHGAFPEKVNTEFVEVIDDKTLRMRVWERGSGETMSCGTGTCAVTVAAVLNGYVKRGTEVEVRIRGGSLYDTYLASGDVLMKGPAATVFSGDVAI